MKLSEFPRGLDAFEQFVPQGLDAFVQFVPATTPWAWALNMITRR